MLYYDITPSSYAVQGGYPQQVTFTFSSTNGVNDEVNDPGSLTICKNVTVAAGGTGTQWVNIGVASYSPASPYSSSTYYSGSVTSAANSTVFTSYSRFTLGNTHAGHNPLPIELLSFTATPNGKVVDVNWTTATQTNNKLFMVERSADAQNFTTVTCVPGAGTTTEELSYAVIDSNPLPGVSYYRLKQIDYDGAATYSDIVSISFLQAAQSEMRLFPNPIHAGAPFNLQFDLSAAQQVVVVVYDAQGRENYSKVVVVSQGNGQVVAIDPENKLAAGLYTIVATSDNSIYRKKLIIK